MADPQAGQHPEGPLSVLLVEGDTDLIFYDRVKELCLDASNRATVGQIAGLFNVNLKILNALVTRHRGERIRAYCCLDRESRYAQTPEFDLAFIRSELRARGTTNVLSVDAIIATQMIESWFLYDIMGIYRFLRIPKVKRNPKAYRPPERFRETDLKALFSRYGRIYREGKRAKNFIEHLDVVSIASGCLELRDGVAMINRQATDGTSHLFP